MLNDLSVTIYDCETGGLDPEEHAITEIALLNFDLKTFTVNWEYQTFVQEYDGLIVTDKALEKTLVTRKDIANGITNEELVEILVEKFIASRYIKNNRGNTITAGHNAIKFDSKFLERLFRSVKNTKGLPKYNLYDYISEEIHDTLSMSKQLWWNKEEKFNLTECSKRAGYKLVGAHSAMNDVRATFELYKYLCLRNRNAGIIKETADGKKKISQVRKYFQF